MTNDSLADIYPWEDFWRDMVDFSSAKTALGLDATRQQIDDALIKVMVSKYGKTPICDARGLLMTKILNLLKEYMESIVRLGGFEILPGGVLGMLRQKTARALYDLVIESGVLLPIQTQVLAALEEHLTPDEDYRDKGIGQN